MNKRSDPARKAPPSLSRRLHRLHATAPRPRLPGNERHRAARVDGGELCRVERLPEVFVPELDAGLFADGGASAVPSAVLFDNSPYSTVTLFARLRGWSASFPMKTAVW